MLPGASKSRRKVRSLAGRNKAAIMNVVITGTSRGIGHELLKGYLEDGHQVYAITRSGQASTDLQRSHEGRYHHIPFHWQGSDELPDILFDSLEPGGVDILINNAGVLHKESLMDVAAEDIREHYEVNVLYPLILSRTLIKRGVMGRGAHIINIGSMAGYQGASKYPGLGAYAMSKGALSILTELMVAEWGSKGISANCLCLGAVETEMFRDAFPGFEAGVKAFDMAKFIRHFATSARGIINGKVIPVSSTDPEG